VRHFRLTIISSILIGIIFFSGCATIDVVETITLRQAEVTGPIMPAPVHLTDSLETSSFTISPRFSYNMNNQLTGEIANSSRYIFVDSLFIPAEHSLVWNIPRINAGVDVDLPFSRNFSFTFGLNYSSAVNHSSMGGNIGMSVFAYKEGTAIRLDGGVQIHSMQYNAFTIVSVTTTTTYPWGDPEVERYIGYFHDINTSTHFDPYFNFTFNTALKNWPINFFINAGYVVQTLLSFSPRDSDDRYGYITHTTTDLRGETTAGFINFTPGIFINIGESSRILFGTRFYFEQNINRANPKRFIMPMMQIDFTM
jgi:hypothetical protein